MSSPPRLKKPKLQNDTVVGATETSQNNGGDDGGSENNAADGGGRSNSREEQEEALVALIEHRVKEVEQLRKRVIYYKSQLDQAEKKLQDTEHKLVHLRRGNNGASSGKPIQNETTKVQVENQSGSAMENNKGSVKSLPQSKPELLIPPVNHKITHPKKLDDYGTKAPMASCSQASASNSKHSNNINKKIENVQKGEDDTKNEDKRRKRKLEEKEHIELIPSIRSSSSPSLIRCQISNHISSQHKRKMRSLSLCPVNDNLFVTSALDGVVNLWQIQARGSGASLLSTTDCLSPKRRWPEDVAWHPLGDSLFFTYSADGDSQISVLDLNKKDERSRVTFLENKPHVKGIINNISFLPIETTCFVTGGSDHAVVLWTEKDGENSWKPKALHRNLHTSAVMGVAGLQQKQIVISAGADKRILGYDLGVERTDFKHQIESKCMSVLPNPCDFNLFMVQTGTPERQLKLYDIRLRKTEVHEFGWKQESSESQSALINQAWSPDGLYITSGSADPVIHIFDIRYNARKPSQSVKAHQKRVFKALWHFSLPLLISISSDLNIGLHKIS